MATAPTQIESGKKDDTAPQKRPNRNPFLTKDTAMSAFTESANWFRTYFEPLQEFERIARNRPSDKIDPQLPRVTDGTMSAIVQETPKRIIQQPPSGKAKCKDYPEYAAMADIVLQDELIPNYSRMGSVLQKSWNMTGKAMQYGVATSYTFLTTTNGKLHTDFTIPYVKDIFGEKGKVYMPDSKIRFMRSWLQKRDIQGIIRREERFKELNPSYVSDWDLPLLKDFMETGASAKPADQMTPAEREKGDGYAGGYEVIHAFQEGVGAEFYSFSPRFQEGKSLRTKINPDPRGAMPFDDMYCNIDLSNPLGRGVIEGSGGVQNLIDQQMQMFQFMSTMEMGPPLMVWGDVKKHTLKFRPNEIWNMGKNLNNKVEPYAVNNNAMANFAENYSLLKSQIMNLNSSQDHSISSAAGNPAQSKTQAGVQASEARLGISDNYLRKQFETWFGNQSETSINIFFAEVNSERRLTLSQAERNELEKTPAKKYVDKEGVLEVPFNKIKDVVFNFHVDASSSEVKESAENVEKLTQTLELILKVPDPQVQAAIPKLVKIIVNEIGAEGTDDLFPDQEVGPDGQPVQQQPQGPDPNQLMQMVQQMVMQVMEQQKKQPKSIAESIKWSPADLTDTERAQALSQGGIQPDPEGTTPNQRDTATQNALDIANTAHQHTMDLHNAAKPEPVQMPTTPQSPQDSSSQQNPGAQQPQEPQGLSEDETQLVHFLLQRGFNDGDVEQGIVMVRQGMPVQQVIQTIGAKYAPATA